MKYLKLVLLPGFLFLALFFFYSVGSILAPFIASIIVAYFLDPLTKNIEKIGLKRKWTVSIIVSLFFLVLITGLIKLIPVLFVQIQEFIVAIPQYEDYVSKHILTKITNFLNSIDPELGERLQAQLKSFSNKFFEYLMVIIGNLFDSSIAMLNLIIMVFLTPILVFYLLRDWPLFVKITKNLFPLIYKKNIMDTLKQIDKVLSAYIRGQINVCLLMMLFYVSTLSLVGLNYALLIGIIMGMLTIIPYIGVVIGFILCSVVALLQFSEFFYVGVTIAIFVVGHLLENYFIIPKLIGGKIGLHPVWVIFALMSGGALFGFWGLFFAIPIAAILGVLLRNLFRFYLASDLYNSKL